MTQRPDSNILHNKIAQDLVRGGLRDLIREGGNFADIMIVMENIMLGCMLVNANVFGQSPQVCTGLAEVALQSAIDRFAAEINKQEAKS